MMKTPTYSSALLKAGVFDLDNPAYGKNHNRLQRAVKRLNHQAKRRDRRERPEGGWKK